jgi:hypothetical protein
MSIFGLVVFAILIFAVCYTTRCLNRGASRNLPREIEKELDPFGKRESI